MTVGLCSILDPCLACIYKKAEKQWRKSKKYDDNFLFKFKRNAFTHQLNIARRKCYGDKIEGCHSDQRKLFSLINSVSKPKEKIGYPIATSIPELANEFSNFFVTKIESIREELDSIETDATTSDYFSSYESKKEFSNFEILSEQQASELIIKSPNEQCIADPLPKWIIKACIDVLLPFITHIINLSLQNGSFAGAWKEAFIIPLLKNIGLGIIFPNLRPVSDLSFISKIAGEASAKQISSHVKLHCPLPTLQSAYKEYHSTETALLKVLSDLLLDIDAQKGTLLVMSDLSAAFDTIDHAILLDILKKKVALSVTILQWVQSYISNRYQCV